MKPSNWSLRTKIILIVSGAVIGYAVIDHLIQLATIVPSFVALEEQQSERDAMRVIDALRGEIEHLDVRCRDRSAWDDTYRFVAERQPEYIASNLGPKAFHDADVNLLYVCAVDGRVVWGEVRDLVSNERITLREFPSQALAPTNSLLAQNTRDGRLAGLISTERGPLLFASRPILTSESTGPSRGTLLMGRFLDDALIQRLSARTKVPVDVWPLDGRALPPSEAAIVDEVTSTATPIVVPVDDARLHAYTTFPDVNAAPALLVRATIDRDVMFQGSTSIRYALFSTIAAGILLLLVLVTLLRLLVLDPIGRLTRHVVAVGKSDDTSARLRLERADEIGVLSREFDGMLSKLADSRAAQVRSARAAGMSELATGVVHNIGNVLNSVNASASSTGERVRNSKLPRLRKLADLITAQSADLASFFASDPRSRHVPTYLSELAKSMEVDQRAELDDLDRLVDGIEHIRRLVQSQQDYAGVSTQVEAVDVAAIVEEAVELAAHARTTRTPIHVEREVADLPRLVLDRHKLTEILVNLVKNACEAIEGSRVDAPCVWIRALRGDEQHLVLRVEDNGPGVAPEIAERIFAHGFTTKPDGHGFGLHFCANAAIEMRGRLRLDAPPPAGGAAFVVELPFQPAPTATKTAQPA